MEKKLWIGSIIALVVLFGVFVIYRVTTNSGIELIKYEDIITKAKQNSFSLIHTGEVTEKQEKQMKEYAKTYFLDPYYTDASVEQLNELLKNYEDLSVKDNNQYVLFLKDKPVVVLDDTTEGFMMTGYLEKYIMNKIPSWEMNYKVLSTAAEYIKKVNSKEYTIAVFGASSCSYCNLYLPVINDVAGKYSLDIYYFDADNYDKDEYAKIQELDITIPAECTLNNQDVKLGGNFPKPMTIITKNGKLVGCLRGYYTDDVVVNKLKEFKLVK